MDSDWGTMGSVNSADEESEQCEIFRASDKAPHIPPAGASIATAIDEHLLFPHTAIAMRAINNHSKYSLRGMGRFL